MKFSANKDLGQHFLKDKSLIDLITHDYCEQADIIVEVGPGPGALTQSLAKHQCQLFLIEKDERFKDHLSSFSQNIFIEDALKFHWSDFISKYQLQDKKIWLVSNLPYNVSSALFVAFTQVPQIQYMTLMYQKEVGEKTYLRPHTKNQMSSLLCLSLNYFEAKKLSLVSPGAFHPPPKVDSIVVSYSRKNSPEISLDQFKRFEAFLRLIFQFKRKQLKSVLKTHKDINWELMGVAPEVRAEKLEISDIYRIYKVLNK